MGTTTDYKSQKLIRVAENLYRTGEGTYFVRAYLGGKNFKQSLKTHDRKTAGRKLADFIKEIEHKTQEAPDIAFEEFTGQVA